MSNRPADTEKNEQTKTALAIAITSGKGGVGKTNLTTNLGIALAKSGHKVCIFDADTSLANINILLGLRPEFTLEQFFNGEKTIEDILITGPEGVKIVPSASGIAELADLEKDQQSRIVEALRVLEQQFDYILIDTAAGISENVINFLQSAQYAIVVISPEPTSLTDAFSLVKVLQRRHYDKPIYTLVNMAKNYKHSMDVFKRFSHAINKYVHLKVRYLGYIPMDQAMRSAVAAQSPVVISEPRSPAARCITLLTQILVKHFKASEQPDNSISTFWNAQISHVQSTISAIETSDIHLQSTKNNEQIISAQQSKETSQILELTYDALSSQEFTQAQTESLLTQTIENYLIQFGALPQQAVDLMSQAYAQNQLPPEVNEQLTRQLLGSPANDETDNSAVAQETAETKTQSHVPTKPTEDPGAQPPEHSKPSSDPISSLKTQIDSLVDDAIRTKRELADLSSYLKDQYQALYNSTQASQHSKILPTPMSQPQTSQQSEDQIGLRQSIRYASAVDQNRKY